MKRLFWMAVGAGVFWYAGRRSQAILERFTPRGIARQAEKSAHNAATGLGEFYATFKTSMEAREAELRDELNLPARQS